MRTALGVVVVAVAMLASRGVARAQDVDAGVAVEDAGVSGAASGDAGTPAQDVDAAPPDAGVAVEDAAVADGGAPAAQPTAIVIDAATYGIDPLVGVLVSKTMRETAAALGYAVLTPEQSVAVAQRLNMPFPPSPADLWRASWLAHAERGAFAQVWAEHGQYVVEVVVASTDGGGPFTARASAPDTTLLGVVAELVRTTLPPPGVRTAPQPAPQNVTPPGATPGPTATTPAVQPPHRRVHSGRARRWVLVGLVDGAFGLAQDFFFNFLAGARLDFRITPDVRVGAGVLGTALRGKGGVAGNMLFLAQVEDRLRIATDSDVRVPLRFAIGYLPFNGPVVRVAAGLEIPFERRWEVVLDLLAVDFWVLPDHTVVSLDVATELGYRF